MLGLAVACIGLFMSTIFRATLTYFNIFNRINDKLVDLKFITVDDYSVACKIPKALYEKFKESKPDCPPNLSMINEFEEYLSIEITNSLVEIYDLDYN